MAIHKLPAVAAAKLTKPGLHADGGGLYLNVGRRGTKSWVLRYSIHGRTREMGLGSLSVVGLADARERAASARRMLADGVDPIEARDAERASRKAAASAAMTFDEAAAAYIASHRAGWKSAKHAAQWEATLKTYASPIIGRTPVQAIDTPIVLKALQPIWATKPETANRLRGRIERVLDWGRVLGARSGENPARWRGHLDHLLPPRSKVCPVVHHPALPYVEIPAFMAELREQAGTSARCLELVILTACRTAEVIGAKWDEFDVVAGVWTIPAARMKAAREHRVPLTPTAAAMVEYMHSIRQNEFVFPAGNRRGPHLSNMAMLVRLARMGRGDLTVHGFRSTFRTWAAERTNFPREVVEAALAHVVGDKVEAAYQRGDLFDRRRELMRAWEAFCSGVPADNVVAFLR